MRAVTRSALSRSALDTVTRVFSKSSPDLIMSSDGGPRASDTRHPERVAGLLGQREQHRMRQGYDFLLLVLALGPNDELYVHSIRVANGDAGLQPAKLHLPGAAKRIRTGFPQRRAAGTCSGGGARGGLSKRCARRGSSWIGPRAARASSDPRQRCAGMLLTAARARRCRSSHPASPRRQNPTLER